MLAPLAASGPLVNDACLIHVLSKHGRLMTGSSRDYPGDRIIHHDAVIFLQHVAGAPFYWSIPSQQACVYTCTCTKPLNMCRTAVLLAALTLKPTRLCAALHCIACALHSSPLGHLIEQEVHAAVHATGVICTCLNPLANTPL
jgi:hypothetical protein